MTTPPLPTTADLGRNSDRAAQLLAAFQALQSRLACACAAAGRPAGAVRLLAVGKTFPADDLRALAEASGQRDFGENRVQEALGKMEALAAVRPALAWHLIGPLQSNKSRPVAERFDWVHSIDRLALAQRLSAQRPAHRPPLNVCLQVNVSGEASKSGVSPAELPALAEGVAALPRLALRGLMSIPAPEADFERQRAPHRALRELLAQLNARGLALDTLSMGMSADLEAAVHEGATIVRVGSALFGGRAVSARGAPGA